MNHPPVKAAARNSSIELLKLIACVIIILSHGFPRGTPTTSTPYLIDPSQATANIQCFILLIIKYFGQAANLVFIVSSSYFLLRSRSVKYHKVFQIISDVFLVSVLFLGVLLLLGYKFPMSVIVKQFIPNTMNTNWFVGCYLLVYLIHPALNLVIKSLNQRQHLGLCLCIVLFYCGLNFILPGRFYYTQLVGFINIYFLVAYIDSYMHRFMDSRKQNICLLLISVVMLLSLIFITNFLGLKISLLSHMADWFSNISNPLIILIGISSFNLVKTFHFENRCVNYLSGLTLLIYIFHANELVMDYVKNDFFSWVYRIYSYDHLLLWCIIFSAILLVASVLLSMIYHTLASTLLKGIFNRIYTCIASLYNRILDLLIHSNND